MSKPNEQIELELTYLAKAIPPELAKSRPIHVVDIYIPKDDTNPHLRLRQRGDKYEITKKQPVDPSDVSVQIELTIPLTKQEYEELAIAKGNRVEKYRYAVTIDGYQAEVDIFRGNLQGLVVIDFEFDDLEQKQSFEAPNICLADVTQEYFIAGGHLAGKSMSDIKKDLKRFNYKAL